jgi:hypothetical protein
VFEVGAVDAANRSKGEQPGSKYPFEHCLSGLIASSDLYIQTFRRGVIAKFGPVPLSHRSIKQSGRWAQAGRPEGMLVRACRMATELVGVARGARTRTHESLTLQKGGGEDQIGDAHPISLSIQRQPRFFI